MKCENCGNNEVTFVYRSNLNGKITEKHLCADCAARQGYIRCMEAQHDRMMRGFFDDSFFGGSMLDGFFGPVLGGRNRLFRENLFDDFFREMPALTAEPKSTEETAAEKKEALVEDAEQGRFARLRRLNALRLAMKRAAHKEDFEEAARLRDEIRALEREHKESA